MYKHISFLLITLILLITGSVSAAEILTSEDIVLDDAVNDNYYITGSNVTINDDIDKDLNIAGVNVVINSNITGDLHIAGKNVVIKGNIGQDLMVLGGTVELKGNVKGDVLVFGGKVIISENSLISGDSIVLGGEFEYLGNISGNLNTITGNVNLNGYIGGDSIVTTQKLIVGNFFDTKTDSSVLYFSPEKAEVSEEVSDNFVYNRTKEWKESRIIQSNISSFFGFWSLLRFITTILMIYLIIHLFKPFTNTVINFGDKKWVSALIIGLIVTIAVPAIAILLMVSLIGLPLGLILLTVFTIVFIIRIAVASMIVGGWFKELYEKKKGKNHKHTNMLFSIIGLVALLLVKLVPYVGDMIYFAISLIAIGAIMHYLYKTVFKRLS